MDECRLLAVVRYVESNPVRSPSPQQDLSPSQVELLWGNALALKVHFNSCFSASSMLSIVGIEGASLKLAIRA